MKKKKTLRITLTWSLAYWGSGATLMKIANTGGIQFTGLDGEGNDR